LQGLLTPVIAIIAVYIAYQQWRVNERKLKFDQYARMLRIYEEVVGILTLVNRDFNPEYSELRKFRASTAEADFLFAPEISAYLDEILIRGFKLRSAHNQYRDFTEKPPQGYDPAKVLADAEEHEKWFMEQLTEGYALKKFKKYLSVTKK
jgi:hypothetical protein